MASRGNTEISSITPTHLLTRLNRDASPIVHYNPDSGFAGLGKELWHAGQQLQGATVPNANWIQWDLNAVSAIKDALISENRALNP